MNNLKKYNCPNCHRSFHIETKFPDPMECPWCGVYDIEEEQSRVDVAANEKLIETIGTAEKRGQSLFDPIIRLKRIGLSDEQIKTHLEEVKEFSIKTKNDYCNMLEMSVRFMEEEK